MPLPSSLILMWSQRRGLMGTVTVFVPLSFILPLRSPYAGGIVLDVYVHLRPSSICARMLKREIYFLSGYW